MYSCLHVGELESPTVTRSKLKGSRIGRKFDVAEKQVTSENGRRGSCVMHMPSFNLLSFQPKNPKQLATNVLDQSLVNTILETLKQHPGIKILMFCIHIHVCIMSVCDITPKISIGVVEDVLGN